MTTRPVKPLLHENSSDHSPVVRGPARRRMSISGQLNEMPAWPALMNSETGALYLELSVGSFRGLVRRSGIRPVDLGLGLVRWRRSDLDALVSALPARGPTDAEAPTTSAFDDALARSAAKAAGPKATQRRTGR